MRFLHYVADAGPSDLVEVRLSGPANVFLLDPLNYQRYRRRENYIYHGGHFEGPEAKLRPPFKTQWHIVVDQGGAPGELDASVRIVSEPGTQNRYEYANQ